MTTRNTLLLVALAAGLASPLSSLRAAEKAPRPVDGIMDNSFLVEEAYNQGPGIVQHILTGFYGVNRMSGPDDKAWEFSFTQEWPLFSQTHQVSYTVPYSVVEAGGQSSDGVGDLLLNYRLQAYFDEATLTAFAPRLSLVLPTGNVGRGFGDGTVGLQVNLPFSTALADRWYLHLNAGATWLPDADSAGGRSLWHANLGASVIYAATSDLHFLVEAVGYVNDRGPADGHDFEVWLSPGVRKAFNFEGNTQLVVGAAAPIGLTRNAPDFGVFLYLSFEHRFLKAQ
jgi:hypothetical protein